MTDAIAKIIAIQKEIRQEAKNKTSLEYQLLKIT